MSPEKSIHSISTSSNVTFNPSGVKEVHSLNGYLLIKNGWTKSGDTYTKDGIELKYDGVHWWNGDNRIQYMEEIKKPGTAGKDD